MSETIGSILTVFVFVKESGCRIVCIFYFVSFSVFNTIYTNCALLESIFTYAFNINLQNSNLIWCRFLYYMSYLSAALYPNNIILASIDRLLMSSRNVNIRLYSLKRLACFAISTSTNLWTIFYSHLLIKTNTYEMYSSVFICFYEILGFYFQFVSYSSFMIALTFSILDIILSVSAFKNVLYNRSNSFAH